MVRERRAMYRTRARDYTVVIEPDDNGTFHIYAPALPGCHSCGATVAEAKRNVSDAIRLYLESLHEDGVPVPREGRAVRLDTIRVLLPA